MMNVLRTQLPNMNIKNSLGSITLSLQSFPFFAPSPRSPPPRCLGRGMLAFSFCCL